MIDAFHRVDAVYRPTVGEEIDRVLAWLLFGAGAGALLGVLAVIGGVVR